MTSSNKIFESFKNILTLWLSTIIVALISFLITIYLANHYGPKQFAKYSLGLSVGSILLIFIEGGARNFLIREKTKASNFFKKNLKSLPGTILGHQLLFLLIIIFLFFIFRNDSFIFYLSVCLCFGNYAFLQYNTAMYQGEGDFNGSAKYQFYQRVFTAFFIVLFLAHTGSKEPKYIFLIWGITGLFFSLFYSRFLKKPRIDKLFKLYKYIFPFILIDLSISIYLRSDLLILNFYHIDQALIGNYSASFKIIEIFILLSGPVGVIFLRSFRSIKHDEFELNKLLKFIFFILLLGILTSILIFFQTNQLITLFFNNEYIFSTEYLRLLSIMIPFILPNTILTSAFFAIGYEKKLMFVVFLGAVINVFFNFYFIPYIGIKSAIYSTIIVEVFIFSAFLLILLRSRKFKIKRSYKNNLFITLYKKILLFFYRLNDSIYTRKNFKFPNLNHNSKILFILNDSRYIHLGDFLFYLPLISVLSDKYYVRLIIDDNHKKIIGNFFNSNLILNNEEKITDFSLIITHPYCFLDYQYNNIIGLGLLNKRITSPYPEYLIKIFHNFFRLNIPKKDFYEILYSFKQVFYSRHEDAPIIKKIKQNKKYIMFAPFLGSGRFRDFFNLKRKKMLRDTLFLSKEYKAEIILIGSKEDFLKESYNNFIDLRGLDLDKVMNIAYNDNIIFGIGFDSFWMHFFNLIEKKYYVYQRRHFSSKSIDNHFNSIDISFNRRGAIGTYMNN